MRSGSRRRSGGRLDGDASVSRSVGVSGRSVPQRRGCRDRAGHSAHLFFQRRQELRWQAEGRVHARGDPFKRDATRARRRRAPHRGRYQCASRETDAAACAGGIQRPRRLPAASHRGHARAHAGAQVSVDGVHGRGEEAAGDTARLLGHGGDEAALGDGASGTVCHGRAGFLVSSLPRGDSSVKTIRLSSAE